MRDVLRRFRLVAAGLVAGMTTYLFAISIGLGCHGLPQLIQWGIEKWMM